MSLNIVQQIDDKILVKNVLVSVWDKTGLETLAKDLIEVNPELRFYSTGGTFKALQNSLGPERAAKHLFQVSDYTGQPEMQGGLVKTLDFKIYLGLLSETYNPAHVQDLQRVRARTLDMVIVNLYPFVDVIAQPGTTPEAARGHIDIGGPCMLRAAAKNFLRVTAVSRPADYTRVLQELRESQGEISLETRFELARTAFETTAAYDRHIAAYWQGQDFASVSQTYHLR